MATRPVDHLVLLIARGLARAGRSLMFFAEGTVALKNRLVYRNEEPTLEIVSAGRPWSFDGDGSLLRLVSEAYRIRIALPSAYPYRKALVAMAGRIAAQGP